MVVLSFLGTCAIRVNPVGVVTIIVFGVIGFYMVRYNYSVIAFVLGVVLGDIAEENLDRSLLISDGSWLVFVDPLNHPVSFLLPLTIVAILAGPVVKQSVVSLLEESYRTN